MQIIPRKEDWFAFFQGDVEILVNLSQVETIRGLTPGFCELTLASGQKLELNGTQSAELRDAFGSFIGGAAQ